MACLKCRTLTSTDGSVVIAKIGCGCDLSVPGASAVLGWGAHDFPEDWLGESVIEGLVSLRAWSDGAKLAYFAGAPFPLPLFAADVGAVIVVARSGVVRKMYARISSAPGVGAYTYTLFVNGVATALVASIALAATEGQDLVNSVAVVAGDKLEVRRSSTGGPDPPETTRLETEFA
jgi:hypothetical protein